MILDKNDIWVSDSVEQPSYPGEGNDKIFQVEDKSFWFRHRNNVIKTVIDRFPFSGNYADVGGGNGFQVNFIANHFKDRQCYLIEPGYQGCLNAKKRGVKNVYNITFQDFDFKEKKVDGVGLYDVVEHIEDHVSFIRELKTKLPAGSNIYITVPAYMALWSDIDTYGGHFRRYNKKMVNELAEKSGTRLIFFSYFFTYVPLITFFLKRIPYLVRGSRSNEAIIKSEQDSLSPSGIITSAFDVFHKRELRKLRSGKLNHGGSCIFILKT